MAKHSAPSTTGDTSPRHSDPFVPPIAESSPEETTSGQIKNALSGFVAARVELAAIEAREAAQYAAKKTTCAVGLGITLFFCWALALAGITGLLAPMADTWLGDRANWLPGWCAVIFALAFIHALIALALLSKIRKKSTTPLFELTRREIENDKQWLKENK